MVTFNMMTQTSKVPSSCTPVLVSFVLSYKSVDEYWKSPSPIYN